MLLTAFSSFGASAARTLWMCRPLSKGRPRHRDPAHRSDAEDDAEDGAAEMVWRGAAVYCVVDMFVFRKRYYSFRFCIGFRFVPGVLCIGSMCFWRSGGDDSSSGI